MTSVFYRNYDQRRHDARARIDQVAADYGNAVWLLGRIMIGSIFVQSGFLKLMSLGGFASSLASHGVPISEVLAPIGAAVEFGGGLAIVLGLGARYAALLMIAFVIVATGISHRFWEYAPPQRQAQVVNFTKNVAIVGGFLFVFVTGGGHYSLDRLWRRH